MSKFNPKITKRDDLLIELNVIYFQKKIPIRAVSEL